MSIEARDPILSGLDELAGMADGDQVTDRMAGISRKARTNRIRHGAVGAASLAVVAAGAVGALQMLPSGDAINEPAPGRSPTAGAESTAPSTPAEPSVTEPALVVTDETSVDLDGDGQADQVKLLKPPADRRQGQSDYAVTEVTRASGQTTVVQISGDGVPTVAGEADLNGDGVPEIQIVSEGEDHSWWTVLTFTGGEVVAATPILSGAEWVIQPETGAMEEEYAGATYRDFQVTWMRDDQLVTWFTGRAWDRDSSAEVTLFPWALDGDELSLSGQAETVCVTPDPATWTNPEPC